ncbi:unnamed protein product [Tilletia controversa]|nr:hypothetical protein CF335_g3316 [Tilletia laevis]CAD6946780.1 unnamed protein product [Tilletia caries]CAD6959747.1 unnamed protein product [Tilletia caries]CAD6969327.1 unnamed protein product [Tilletia controversa]CAD6984769.1 unnamed protein product [Tilletia controversa]
MRGSRSPNGVGLGLQFSTSSPGRSPLRRRRSETESDNDGEGSSQVDGAAAAAAPVPPAPAAVGPAAASSSAGLGKAVPGNATRPALRQDVNGLAAPPPFKRGRGRPRKNPLPGHAHFAGIALSSSAVLTSSSANPPTSSQDKAAAAAAAAEKRPSRPSNGRASASRSARASAAAEANRRALAALEASSSEEEAEASGSASSETEPEPEEDEPEGPAGESSANGEQPAKDEKAKDEETAEQEAREMASRWTEEYYEIVEQLPLELTRCFTLMRETEGKVQNRLEKTRKFSQAYFKARRDLQVWVNYYAAKSQDDQQGVASPNPLTATAGPSSQIAIEAEPVSLSKSAKGKEKMDTSADDLFNAAEGKDGVAPSHPGPSLSTAPLERTPAQKQQGPPLAMLTGLQHRLALLNAAASATHEAKRAADEKVELARTACELVDRLVLRLDADLTRSEVGLALGLRTGTEESRGAREAQGALTLAQNEGVGSVPATGTDLAETSRGGEREYVGNAGPEGESSASGSRSMAEKRGESRRSGRPGLGNGTEGPSKGDEPPRGRVVVLRRPSANSRPENNNSNSRKASDRPSQAGPSIFSPPADYALESMSGGGFNRKDKQRASVSGTGAGTGTDVRGVGAGPKAGSSRSNGSSRSGEGGGGPEDASVGSRQSRRKADKGKGKGPAGDDGVLTKASQTDPEEGDGGEGAQAEELGDEDADGDEDAPGDEEKYCYCDDYSDGFMIACDGDNCPLQWCHYKCVGLPEHKKPPGKWYCLFCKPSYKGPGRGVPANARLRPTGVPVGGNTVS